MILATAITNLVLALMIQKPSVTVNNDGTFGISVETQYVHSVTLNEFDRMCASNRMCLMCNKPIALTPIDYLGVKPCRMDFRLDELCERKFHPECDPWIYVNTNAWPCVVFDKTNGWFTVKEVWP